MLKDVVMLQANGRENMSCTYISLKAEDFFMVNLA